MENIYLATQRADFNFFISSSVFSLFYFHILFYFCKIYFYFFYFKKENLIIIICYLDQFINTRMRNFISNLFG